MNTNPATVYIMTVYAEGKYYDGIRIFDVDGKPYISTYDLNNVTGNRLSKHINNLRTEITSVFYYGGCSWALNLEQLSAVIENYFNSDEDTTDGNINLVVYAINKFIEDNDKIVNKDSIIEYHLPKTLDTIVIA